MKKLLLVLLALPLVWFGQCISGDCVNGQGTKTWANWDKYVGEWKDDNRTGQGTYTWASGNKYVGEWKDNKRNGQGTGTLADGIIKKGLWQNGKFLGESFAQTIKDIDGNYIRYKKIGDLYWTENIRTTTLWSNDKPLKLIDKAPTPRKDYSGALYIDANDKYRFSGRYYSVNESDYYYTCNTANNVTATQQMAQSKFEEVKDNNTSICPCG